MTTTASLSLLLSLLLLLQDSYFRSRRRELPPPNYTTLSLSTHQSDMQKYQRNLALVYPLTVAVGSAIHTTIQVPYTIFADRRNPLNTVFAKRGWFWTGTTLFLFLLLSSTDRKRAPIIRWALATLYWVIFAQWAFGHSVFDRVLTMSGTCSIEEHGHPAICRKNGGEWLGFDVSGHCFLLIHMSLFIFEELQILIAPSASTSASASTTSSQQKPTPDAVDYSTDTSVSSTDGATLPSIPVTPSTTPLTTLRSRLPHPTSTAILSSILIFLLMLWYCMLIATSLYFHSWQEKVMGTVAGMAYWVVMYVVVWPKWFPGMAPGLPKGKEIYGGSGIGGGKKRAAAMRVKRQ